MRTQGWWLNVAKKHSVTPSGRVTYLHYCSIWLGDNRVGEDEKQKAAFLVEQIAGDSRADEWRFTLTEEWISGKEHPL